jgi:hypothetical protein
MATQGMNTPKKNRKERAQGLCGMVNGLRVVLK